MAFKARVHPYRTNSLPSRFQPKLDGIIRSRSCRAVFREVTAEATSERQEHRRTRVHYLRKDRNYKGWGLHVWGDVPQPSEWSKALAPSGLSNLGAFWDVEIGEGAPSVGLLVHKGEDKSAGGNVVKLNPDTQEVWLVANDTNIYLQQPDLSRIPTGSLSKSYGHWVNPDTIVWRMAAEDADKVPRKFQLHCSREAHMHITGAGVQNADAVFPLLVSGSSPSSDVLKKFPFLYGATVLKLPEEARDQISDLVKGQLAITVSSSSGEPIDATSVQMQGVLDSLFTYSGPLGDAEGGIHVWAPTAQKVELMLWPQARAGTMQLMPMEAGPNGVWSIPRPSSWLGWCYKFRVTVYCPWSLRIEVSEATDPYARAVTADGERTIIVDIDDPALMPQGWPQHRSPPLAQWTDVSVYEMHIRDFSISDSSVPEQLRGKYLAFCPDHVSGGGGRLSAGLSHLATLRESGLNHLHLLPTYDFGSVPERQQEQARVQDDLSRHPPDSEAQQSAVLAVADSDGFNWGYDPVHYGVPEGSYATDPDTPVRVREFREMVSALHQQGWRVVLDVVYNHTFRSGPQDRYSVLDKVVPGYYHRRGEDGDICNSTCCNNTASEHAMCERLVVDDIVHWARSYKVDGFRFDIMGHLLVSTMNKIRTALDQLTPERDGVDGPSMYVYGEAWDFGEMAFNQRGRNASQLNLAGSGLGAFNDRLRDGAMGGSPFSSVDFQGFVTGVYLQPNSNPEQGDPAEQLRRLLAYKDWIRLALAGNLRDFEIVTMEGKKLRGSQVTMYGSTPVAYGALPAEHVAYCGCHDNETIFDQVAMKAASAADGEARMRMCLLSMALCALGQGVPFFHAGDDLLRSKSLDRDSYNSGDWFNRVDWTGQDNNFGVGLPPATKNAQTWDLKRRLLADPALKPPPSLIAAATRMFQALLRVRYSSPLFRMADPADVLRQLSFHDMGPEQAPGLIVMELASSAPGEGTVDPLYEHLLVVFNAAPDSASVPYPDSFSQLQLHPALAALKEDAAIQQCKADNDRRVVQVATRTAAVFVQGR